MYAKNVYATSSQPTSHQERIVRQCNLALLSEPAAADLVSRKGKSNNSIPRFLVMAGFLGGYVGRQGVLASSTAAGAVGGGGPLSLFKGMMRLLHTCTYLGSNAGNARVQAKRCPNHQPTRLLST